MRRVLVFSLNYYPRFVGGAEVAIKEITGRIPREEIEFHVLCLRFDKNLPREEKMGNVVVHRVGFARKNPDIADLKRFPLHLLKYWYQLGAAYHALRLHRQYRFDGVWAMMAHSCGIPAALFKMRHPSVAYLLTLQEGDTPRYIERMMRPAGLLFRQAFTRADELQPISSFLLAWGRRMGYPRDAAVIPNAVDTKQFTATLPAAEVEEARRAQGHAPGDFMLVTTSRLVHKNAVDDVIRALALLPPSVKLAVYGIGPDEAMLRSLAQELGVAERVRFLGYLDHERLPFALRAADAFVRPSRSEGLGNSFIEAMAAEIPVIGTQEGGIADFLFDANRNPEREATGWAVDRDTPDHVAAAVLDIRDHPEKVRRTTHAARRLVVERFDWSTVAKDMRALFDRMLKSR